MQKRWAWSCILYCLSWYIVAATISTALTLSPSLPLVLGWVPRQPNTSYYISDFPSLVLWTPVVFINSAYLITKMFFVLVLIYSVFHVIVLNKILKIFDVNPVIISMAIGLTIGMVLAGLTTVLPAPVPGAPNAIIIDPGQPPSAKEKLLDYGIPAWIASVVSGLVVGWLWRVYPLRIQIKFVLEDEKNK